MRCITQCWHVWRTAISRASKRTHKRKRANYIQASDAGSGTVLGVMLVALLGVGLMVTSVVGNLLTCQARARSLADSAAIAAAVAQLKQSDACAAAAQILASTAAASRATLAACHVEARGDVVVRVQYKTAIPLAAQIAWTSRAGPVDCT